MFDYLVGKITEIGEKKVTLLVNGFAFLLKTPQTANFKKVEDNQKIFTYMHWNQEKGPSLFGFKEEMERTLFLLIIECSKIGPSIALSILSQMTTEQFIEIITTQNEKGLSSVNGIGPKKAEQIIVQLKHKISKLISTGKLAPSGDQQDFTQWQNINEVLTSLNYSKPEISKAIKYLMEKHSGQTPALDKLIRSALSFLSGNLN